MVVGVSASDGRVPSALPPILKNYTKAAIRTQPRDIVAWSYTYFKSLQDGDAPPVKEQLEFPLPDTKSGVSPGLMRVMHKKFEPMGTISLPQLEELGTALGIKEWAIQGAWEASDEADTKPWNKLLLDLIGQEVQTMTEKLAFVMQTVSDDLITRRLSVEDTLMYFDMIHQPESDAALHESVKEYLNDVASYQEGFLIPSDLSRPTCPLNEPPA